MIFSDCRNITYHITWYTFKLRPVGRSSKTTEILAAAETVDVTVYSLRIAEIILPFAQLKLYQGF